MAPRSVVVRVGLLGCGSIAAEHHLPNLRRGRRAVLVAAADPDPVALRRAAAGRGVELHAAADEVLERDDVDAVVISVPSHLHAELAVAAATAGKHVYLEKPIATSAEDGRRVKDAADRAGIVAVTGFNRRLHPLCRQARAIVAAGEIGCVRSVQTAFCEPVPVEAMPAWKRRRTTGGGVLLDLASHHVDLLRWLLGEELEVEDASLSSEETDDDRARLRLSTPSGAEIQSVFSFREAHADHVELIGERGTLRIDRHRAALALTLPRRLGYGVRRLRPRPDRDVVAWRLQRLARLGAEPSYRRSLGAFVDRIRGTETDAATVDDGLRSLEVVLAAERIARPGG